MSRIDIARLRKDNGMSQGELASQLQITQSFLSAIENGKSPLPLEKESKLCEIFGLSNLNDYSRGKNEHKDERKVNDMTDSDLFNQLLNRFHKQAHSLEDETHHHSHHMKIDDLQSKLDKMFERNDKLMERNEKLSEDNDRLRKELDARRNEIENLRQEIYRLKSQ